MLKKLSTISTEKKILLLFVVGYVVTFLFFYPSFFASMDEHDYLYNSYLIRKHNLVVEDKTLHPFGHFNGEGYVSKYFVGKSIFMIPFTYFGWEAVFLSELLIHLFNAFIFYNIIKKLKFDEKNVLLYLFYPTFFWKSRTISNELLALTCILAAFYFYLSDSKRSQVLSGAMFGLACLVRYETLLIFLCFGAVALLKDRKKLSYMIVGFTPIALFILTINKTYYTAWFGTGYGLMRTDGQNVPNTAMLVVPKYLKQHFIKNLLAYSFFVTVSYPLMSFGPIFYRGKARLEILVTLAVYLLFFANNLDVSYSILSLTQIIIRQRYIIPILGFFLITYIPFYESALKKMHIPKDVVFWLVIMVLFTGSVYMSRVHQNFLDGRHTVFEQIYENTKDGSLILGSGDDGMYVMPGVFGDRRYVGLGTLSISETKRYIDKNTYLVYLQYKTQINQENVRAKTIAAERKWAADFIEANKASLTLTYNTTEPHYLEIYRVAGPID